MKINKKYVVDGWHFGQAKNGIENKLEKLSARLKKITDDLEGDEFFDAIFNTEKNAVKIFTANGEWHLDFIGDEFAIVDNNIEEIFSFSSKEMLREVKSYCKFIVEDGDVNLQQLGLTIKNLRSMANILEKSKNKILKDEQKSVDS